MAGHRAPRRVYLSEAGVTEQGTFLVRTPYGSRVRALGVRRKVKHVAVASRAEYDGVPAVCFDLPRDKIAGDNTSRHAIDHNQVEQDRKSTRLNSSHVKISYAVFCLKK